MIYDIIDSKGRGVFMEILFEFLLECLFSGAVEGSRCKKMPKGVRIFLGLFVIFFVIAIIGIIVFAGVLAFKVNIVISIILFAFAGFMGFMAFRKASIEYKEAVHKDKASQADMGETDSAT